MERKTIDLKEILSEVFHLEKNAVTAELNNSNVKDWDSLAHVNLVTKLEEHLGKQLQAREIAKMTSVIEILKIFNTYNVKPHSAEFEKICEELKLSNN